jgi:hypothetical protein
MPYLYHPIVTQGGKSRKSRAQYMTVSSLLAMGFQSDLPGSSSIPDMVHRSFESPWHFALHISAQEYGCEFFNLYIACI